jgi:hypothetical protein
MMIRVIMNYSTYFDNVLGATPLGIPFFLSR